MLKIQVGKYISELCNNKKYLEIKFKFQIGETYNDFSVVKLTAMFLYLDTFSNHEHMMLEVWHQK